MLDIDSLESIASELNRVDPTDDTKIKALYEQSISQISAIESNQIFVETVEQRNIIQIIQRLISNSLKFILDNHPDNYTLILKISNLLASFDTNIVRFSVDAGIIDRLGKELVSKHDTAVSELVKNAYDADAKIVKLSFHNVDKIGGTLVVEDNGEGMSKTKLINGFMRLSSRDKIENPVSLKYLRRKAGRKGIGRFATQRLGQKLTIITQTVDCEKALKLVIDWDDFKTDSDVGLIENKIEEIEKDKANGTTLVISNLRDSWTDAAINRVYGYVTDLLQPFPLSEEHRTLNIDPGFKVECSKVEGSQKIIIANEEVSFFEHATAEIEAYVDFDGCAYYSINSKILGIKDEIEQVAKSDDDETFGKIKNVHLKAYYYIYEPNSMPKNAITMIRQKLKSDGGIRLYRNGFRVPPYGQDPDDWLKLDASVRKRVLLTPHGNINFFGFIEVLDEQGNLFEEQSSREGLLKNDTFDELTIFGHKVLTSATIRIAERRVKKATTSQKDWEPKTSKEKMNEVFEKLEEKLEETFSKTVEKDINKEEKVDDSNVNNEIIKEILYEFKGVKEDYVRESDEKIIELIDENSMLRVLAGLGLTIGEFIHEIKFYQAALHGDSDNIIQLLEGQAEQYIALRIKEHLKSLNTYTAYFDSTISQNVQRELENIDLRTVVRPFVDVIRNDAKSSGIEILDPDFQGFDLYTCPMHKSEWTSILFNLYSNAKKAIKKGSANGRIFINCGKQDNIVYVNFSDNGIGIPDDKKERIFNAFYTTSTPVGKLADEYTELRGTGLGLKILKDIVEGYGGKIEVTSPLSNFQTTIRIEIPKKREK